jgi:hypothetical protein
MNTPQPEACTPLTPTALLQVLQNPDRSWLDCGSACQNLHSHGYSPQEIFTAVGCAPEKQQQWQVAIQVYASLERGCAPAPVLRHFGQAHCDVLCAFADLSQLDRVHAATLAVAKHLSVDEAYSVAQAIQDFAHMPHPPEGFSTHAGDAVAYQCWQLAQQQSDLPERSGLIARGLRFAHSDTARQQLQTLLCESSHLVFSEAPEVPFCQVNTLLEWPRMMPFVGRFPLDSTDFAAVPPMESKDPFPMVMYTGEGAWVSVPRWSMICQAQDPVGFGCQSDDFPRRPGEYARSTEETGPDVLVIIDRAQRSWKVNHYFVVADGEQTRIDWSLEPLALPLLGQVICVTQAKPRC